MSVARALLFYAGQARPGSKATDLLRERFRLEELIPDRDALLRARGAVTGRDASLFHSIGEAVREELGQVKDTLDMELRTGRIDAEQRLVGTGRVSAGRGVVVPTVGPLGPLVRLLPWRHDRRSVGDADRSRPGVRVHASLMIDAIVASHGVA